MSKQFGFIISIAVVPFNQDLKDWSFVSEVSPGLGVQLVAELRAFP